jgi:transposase-like protein
MRGKARTEEERIKAIEMMAVSSVLDVSRQTGIPESTLRAWRDGKTKSSKQNAEEFAKLRAEKKAEFVEKAWDGINDAIVLLKDKLKADKELSAEERKLKSTDLTNIIGVLYDKQALANNEATLNAGIKITLSGDLDKYAD